MVDAMTREDRAQVSDAWLALVRGPEERARWGFSFAAMSATGETIGSGGFKGPPEDGVVEIAYGVQPAHRGKGYASEIAAALTDYALSRPEVMVVRAHTLAEGMASQRALARAGFAYVGEVIDPEDGPVTRFERKRTDQGK